MTDIEALNLAVKPQGSPETLSTLHSLSLGEWGIIRDLMGGAKTVRQRGEAYLPKFPDESQPDYDLRLKTAPFFNHFVDSLDDISGKPFTKPVDLQGNVADQLKALATDVDGSGRTIHAFAKDVFEEGVGLGRAGVFVDYPKIPEGATLADERSIGARPILIDVRAEDLLAFDTDFRGGRRVCTHLRFRQRERIRRGFREVPLTRVRYYAHPEGFERPIFQIFERVQNGTWTVADHGTLSVPEIPFQAFDTGKIIGDRLVPPLMGLAYLQLEHYQQHSNLKNILLMAGFPMLTGNGITPPQPLTLPDGTTKETTIRTGPGHVLFAPPSPGSSNVTTSWTFIEPSGKSIECLQAHLLDLERQMAKLGRQPLVKPSGNATATGEAVNAARAQATAESWANDCAKVLTTAMGYAARYLGQDSKATVAVHTDFGLSEVSAEIQPLLDATAKGMLSRETLWDEWRRRNVLGPQFDRGEEAKRLAADQAAADERAQNNQRASAEIAAAFAPKSDRERRPTS